MGEKRGTTVEHSVGQLRHGAKRTGDDTAGRTNVVQKGEHLTVQNLVQGSDQRQLG